MGAEGETLQLLIVYIYWLILIYDVVYHCCSIVGRDNLFNFYNFLTCYSSITYIYYYFLPFFLFLSFFSLSLLFFLMPRRSRRLKKSFFMMRPTPWVFRLLRVK